MRATSTSWKNLPPPDQRESLGLDAHFSAAEFEQMQAGLVPEAMEDRWFIYYDDGWLRFHRSWTGHLIYAIQFAPSDDGVRAVSSWANRNPEEYRWNDADYDRQFVLYMIDALLLKKDSKAPEPPAPKMHLVLTDRERHGNAPEVEAQIALTLLIGANEVYGEIFGKLVLASMPAVGGQIFGLVRSPLSSNASFDPIRCLTVRRVIAGEQPGDAPMLLLDDVVTASTQDAATIVKHCEERLGLQFDPAGM